MWLCNVHIHDLCNDEVKINVHHSLWYFAQSASEKQVIYILFIDQIYIKRNLDHNNLIPLTSDRTRASLTCIKGRYTHQLLLDTELCGAGLTHLYRSCLWCPFRNQEHRCIWSLNVQGSDIHVEFHHCCCTDSQLGMDWLLLKAQWTCELNSNVMQTL